MHTLSSLRRLADMEAAGVLLRNCDAVVFDTSGGLMEPQPHPLEIQAHLDGRPMYPGDLLRLRDPWYGFSTCEETEPAWLTDEEREAFDR